MEGELFPKAELVEKFKERHQWSEQAVRCLVAKILTSDASPLRWYCKKCQKVTEWHYFGFATLVGLTFHCGECGASTYDGMADYEVQESASQNGRASGLRGEGD